MNSLGDSSSFWRKDVMSKEVSSNGWENPTEMFLHCWKCLEVLDRNPKSMSPEKYARLNVGLVDKNTLMIWCVRHGVPVATLPVDSSDMLDDGGFYCMDCGKRHQLGEGH